MNNWRKKIDSNAVYNEKYIKIKIKFYNGKSMKIIIILIKNPNKKFIIIKYQKKAFNIFV